MKLALQQAQLAFEKGEIPVGAIIIDSAGNILAAKHNYVETNRNATHHAEILCINEAIEKLGLKYIVNATIYVTLEPCAMCAGAMVLTKIKRLVYGADDPKAGAVNSLFNIASDKRLNHRLEITSGILEIESSQLLKEFFKLLRTRKNEIPDQ